MKKPSFLLLLLLPLLGSAQSIQKLEDKFTSGKVSEAELKVFEERAVQKLKDFNDYLDIISNKKLDKRMRQDAIKQAEALFTSPDCKIRFTYENMSISDYINRKYKYGNGASPQIDSVTVGEPLTFSNGSYKGTLHGRSSNGGVAPTITIQMQLIKVQKKFGDEVKDVWDVRLCGS